VTSLRTRAALALALLAPAWMLPAAAPAVVRAADSNGRVAPDFTLTDQNGHPFTLSAQRGRPVVLFFGYTHCPDVCPTILADLRSALAAIGPTGASVVVALITVDPARDRAADLRRYVSIFNPAFRGLTGSPAALAGVYRAYHVRFAKEPASGADYQVSHTAFVYYVGRDRRIRALGTWSDPQAVLEDDLRDILNSRA
jgi:protein SCO1/2